MKFSLHKRTICNEGDPEGRVKREVTRLSVTPGTLSWVQPVTAKETNRCPFSKSGNRSCLSRVIFTSLS